jgi:hypothetical protein
MRARCAAANPNWKVVTCKFLGDVRFIIQKASAVAIEAAGFLLLVRLLWSLVRR